MRKTGWSGDRELLDAVLKQDPHVERTDATAAELGLTRVKLHEVAGDWHFPPVCIARELTVEAVLSCRAATWRDRPMS